MTQFRKFTGRQDGTLICANRQREGLCQLIQNFTITETTMIISKSVGTSFMIR